MVVVRITGLPAGSPTQGKKLAMDLSTAESATIKDIVYAGRPAASQAEAEAGIDADKVMTAVTTKQSIAAQVGVSIASNAQGTKADSALQPAAIGTTVATIAQGVKADSAMQPAVYDPDNQRKRALLDQGVKHPFKVKRDKLNYGIAANLIRTLGDSTYNTLYGTQREIQSADRSDFSNCWYSVHDNDQVPNLSILTRYPIIEGTTDFTQDANSLPSLEYPHQCIACEPGSAKLWGTNGDDKLKVMRFDFAAGAAPANKQVWTLFNPSNGEGINWNTDVSCFDSLSPRWVIGHGKIIGEETVIFRLWDRAKLLALGPGDVSLLYDRQIYAGALYLSGTYPVQGATSPDDRILVAISGGNDYTVGGKKCYRYDIDSGALLEADDDFRVGEAEAAVDGTGISYELEGAISLDVGGVKKVCVGVRSGSSLNPSIYRVYAMGVDQAADFNVSSSTIVARFRRIRTIIGQFFINTAGFSLRAVGAAVNLRFGVNGVDQWEVSVSDNSLRPMSGDANSLGGDSGVSRRILNVMSQKFSFDTNLRWTLGVAPTTESAAAGSLRLVDGLGRRSLLMKTTGTQASPTTTSDWVELALVRPAVRVITASGAIAVTATDDVVVVAKTTGAASAVSLPASPLVGQTVTIKDGKGDAATNVITITPAAGNVDGAATKVINTAYGSVQLAYSGTQWLSV